MVAVGDDELLVSHGGDDEVDEVSIGELPDAVQDAVFVADFEVGWVAGSEEELFGGEGWVGVEHIDLLAVGAGGFEEGETVGFVLGEGLLVAVDDVVGVVVEVAEGDEAAAGLDLLGAGDGVLLGVAVEGGLGFFAENAFSPPGGERLGGAGVDVVLRGGRIGLGGEGIGVPGLFAAENDADQVVLRAVVVGLLHGGGDLVVGLGDDVFHADLLGIVTQGAEGVDAGHGVGCSPEAIVRWGSVGDGDVAGNQPCGRAARR